ncbi:MAG: hypothetical protein ACREQ5_34585, partial [Candidatus Dormibacteria bacterium]
MLSAMTEGVLLFDPSGALMYANPAAHVLLDHLGGPIHGLHSQQLRDALVEGDAATLSEPTSVQLELPNRVIEATASAARPPGSVVVVVRDVTD